MYLLVSQHVEQSNYISQMHGNTTLKKKKSGILVLLLETICTCKALLFLLPSHFHFHYTTTVNTVKVLIRSDNKALVLAYLPDEQP